MKRGTRIAIIGAGLGGATAAAWLQREGFPVRIFEQARSFERIGAGIHVSANVMKVLRRLGAEQRLSQIGIHPDIFTSRKWDTGEVLFELPLGDTGERNYGASYITVHRHDLHEAILEKVELGTIAFARRLTNVKQDSDVVRLSFADGSEAEADVVIGADGVNSKLREAVVGPSQSRFSGAVAHRAALTLGQQVLILNAGNDRELEIAFVRMLQQRAAALLVASDSLFFDRREQLVALVARHSIPAIYYLRAFPQAGRLSSYGKTLTALSLPQAHY